MKIKASLYRGLNFFRRTQAFTFVDSSRRASCISICLFAGFFFVLTGSGWTTLNAENINIDSQQSRYKQISVQWGGHLKVRGNVSWPGNDSVFQTVRTHTFYDENIEFRLKNQLHFGEWGYFETHYEAFLVTGDTVRKGEELKKLFPGLSRTHFLLQGPVEDDRRFFDLTSIIEEDGSSVIYHRLDRLSLTLLPDWGVVRLGRQPITWGHGFIFNPMDLFNPFQPTDIEREYKIGDDMVYSQIPLKKGGDVQLLYVPRRNPSNGDLEWSQSSLAGKFRFSVKTTDLDIMAARHYEDYVIGLGSTGYAGDAAWRLDATWTFLGQESTSDGYLSLVTNIDYSWMWWNKNLYGFIEFFYNGLGKEDYTAALNDPDITERLDRGELFTLGRTYLSGSIRVEMHPLFNIFLTVINNMADPSGILQPYAVWDATQNFQVTFGGNVFYGGRGSEFGGFQLPETTLTNEPPNSAFLWLSYYF